MVPACAELGISQIVWSPLAQGILTGKYAPGEQPPADSRAAHPEAGQTMQAFLHDDLLAAVQGLRPLAAEAGLSMAQLAVTWVLRRPTVAAVIVGASRPEQVTEATGAVGTLLDDDLLRRIDETLAGQWLDDPGITARMAPQQRPT